MNSEKIRKEKNSCHVQFDKNYIIFIFDQNVPRNISGEKIKNIMIFHRDIFYQVLKNGYFYHSGVTLFFMNSEKIRKKK